MCGGGGGGCGAYGDLIYSFYEHCSHNYFTGTTEVFSLTTTYMLKEITKEIILDIAEICGKLPVNQNCVGKYTAEN